MNVRWLSETQFTKQKLRQNSKPPAHKKTPSHIFLVLDSISYCPRIFRLLTFQISVPFMFQNVALPKFHFPCCIRSFRFFAPNVVICSFTGSFYVVCCHMWWSMFLSLLQYVDYASMLVCCFVLVAFYCVT